MTSAPLRLGTRGSALALAQAELVKAALGGEAEIVVVKTEDDAVGDKARFVRGIEQALLAGEVDLAVHSAKDLPAEMTEGLEIAAVPPREDPRDAYIGAVDSLEAIPQGAEVGTASLRRRSQLLAARPDLVVSEIRGNVDTRLRKLAESPMAGIVLATAGLRRLGVEGEVSHFGFPVELMTPAPGQGALALQVRSGDSAAAEAARGAEDEGDSARIEVSCEFAAVAALGASCDTPVGVHAVDHDGRLRVEGYCGLPDGSEWVRDAVEGTATDPRGLGRLLAERMQAVGAAELLERAEQEAAP